MREPRGRAGQGGGARGERTEPPSVSRQLCSRRLWPPRRGLRPRKAVSTRGGGLGGADMSAAGNPQVSLNREGLLLLPTPVRTYSFPPLVPCVWTSTSLQKLGTTAPREGGTCLFPGSSVRSGAVGTQARNSKGIYRFIAPPVGRPGPLSPIYCRPGRGESGKASPLSSSLSVSMGNHLLAWFLKNGFILRDSQRLK